MRPPPPYDIDGFKELGELLGMSRSSLRRAIARPIDPLPVRPLVNGRVVAESAQVRAWHARQVVPLEAPPANEADAAKSA